MKNIEDIEKLTEEQLLQMADDESVAVPEGLGESLRALVGAAQLTKPESVRRRPAFIPWAAAAAVAAALAVGISLSIPRRPKDTFSDPYLAYAEVQRTLNRIAQKGNQAAEIAGEAVPAIEKTEEILNKISR